MTCPWPPVSIRRASYSSGGPFAVLIYHVPFRHTNATSVESRQVPRGARDEYPTMSKLEARDLRWVTGEHLGLLQSTSQDSVNGYVARSCLSESEKSRRWKATLV